MVYFQVMWKHFLTVASSLGTVSLIIFAMCRLDSLVGLFAVGCQPTATADPFGLRRSAYGLV